MVLQIQTVIYGNEKEALRKAIKALKRSVELCQRKYRDLKVRLVYGDSTPLPVFNEKEVKEIQNITGDILEFVYHPFGFNSGTSKGHNVMGGLFSFDRLLIMNPDVIFEPRCLERLLDVLEGDESIGMTEARQTPLEHAKVYDAETGEAPWVSMACTLMRGEVFHKLKGLDAENFFLYCDDLDFSWRARLEGYRLFYVPSAVVYHAKELSVDAKWQPTEAEVYYSAEAAILIAYKYTNNERVKRLCRQFSLASAPERRAAESFAKRKAEQTLPQQIDAEHKVACFLGDDYSKMRFHYN